MGSSASRQAKRPCCAQCNRAVIDSAESTDHLYLETIKTTKLYAAASRGHEDCVAALLALTTTNIDEPGSNAIRWRPIHIAAHRGYAGVIRLLIAYGADIQSPPAGFSCYGTPRDFAELEGHCECVAALDAELKKRRQNTYVEDRSEPDFSLNCAQPDTCPVEFAACSSCKNGGKNDCDGVPRVLCSYAGDLPLSFSIRQGCFHDCGLGGRIWPSAHVMASWMFAHRMEVLEGKRVLELGAGPGLLSLVAARHGATTVLATDYVEGIVDLVADNARFNGFVDGQIQTASLDYRNISDDRYASLIGNFETIVGSDLIYGHDLVRFLVGALAILLGVDNDTVDGPERRSTFYGVMQTDREGVSEFADLCYAQKLRVVKRIPGMGYNEFSGISMELFIIEKDGLGDKRNHVN